MSVGVRLDYPMGAAGWQRLVALQAVPREGETIVLDEETWPIEDERGREFVVRSVYYVARAWPQPCLAVCVLRDP